MNFQTLLKKGTWESVYKNKDPNHMFKNVHRNELNIFQASYPVFFEFRTTKKKKKTE
jgi:hypothetical protein